MIQNQAFTSNSIKIFIKFTSKINECHKIATKFLLNKILLQAFKSYINKKRQISNYTNKRKEKGFKA